MQVIFAPARTDAIAPVRVVMLAAAYSGPDDFVREGFIDALRERRLDVDLVFAGIELQQVIDRTAPEQLRKELILPARTQGCTVWLGGISLGGYLALCCAARHPAEVAGLCLFAPYLGSHIVTGEIERARGVESWEPTALTRDDDERQVWRFIKGLRSSGPAIHLGLGSEDRFAARHQLMAAALEPTQVDVVSGGHGWPTWRQLWARFLDTRLSQPLD